MMNNHDIERLVDSYIDNGLADMGYDWNELDTDEQEVWLREAVETVAEKLDIDEEDVWDYIE